LSKFESPPRREGGFPSYLQNTRQP
jgi:hypothetical protein